MSEEVDWPVKYPWRLLPRGGKHPFVPPPGRWWLRNPLRGVQGGYEDAFENDWVPARNPTGREEDFHWDVEHPDGTHTNVRPNGDIHHGPDNFP